MEEFQLIQETKEEYKNDNKISKDIICNICKEICFISCSGYTFNLYGCKNNHITKNILIENFEDTQRIQNDNHNIHENEKGNYNCNIHNGEQFIKYCKNHKKIYVFNVKMNIEIVKLYILLIYCLVKIRLVVKN